MTDKYTCDRCGMSFDIQAPVRGASASRREDLNLASVTRCSEPGCGLRFWHGVQPDERVRVGIAPEDVPDRAPVRPA